MTRERFHAIFLAAIMLLSVVAMGAGFAGSAAAQEAGQGDVVVLDENGERIDAAPFDEVQTAVDNSQAGYTVVVGAGTYDGDVSIEVERVTLRSADGASATINGIVTLAATGVTIDGLIVDAGADNAAPIDVQSGGATVSNNTVLGGAASGGISTWGGSGPVIGDVSIRDNTVEGGSIGLVVDSQSTNIVVRNNSISDTTAEGVWLSDFTESADISGANITVEANDIDNAALADVKIEQSAPNSLNGESELGTPSETAEAFLSGNSAETVTLWDGETYDENGNTVVLEGESIQDAVEAAEPGDTIAVKSGSYDEQITIATDDITLEPVGTDAPTLTRDSGTVVKVEANGVALSGFDIVGGETFDNSDLGVTVRNDASVSLSDLDFEGLYGAVQTGSGAENSLSAADVSVSNTVFAFGHQSETGSAVVRDSTISVNTQGFGIYKANNVLIENNTITVDAGEIDGEAPVFDTERGIDFSGSNVTITENDIVSTDTGILSESYGIPVEDVRIADNEIDAQSVAVSDAPGNLDLGFVRATNEFVRAAYLLDSDGVQSDAIYGSIDRAVDAAADGDLVTVGPGMYDEDVSVETSNISIVGQDDDTVINGLVYLNDENVTLANVSVEPDKFVRPSGEEGLPNNEKQAILITASDVSVYDSTVDVSLDANGAFEEVNAIQVFGGDPLTGVQIVGNDITGTASNDEVAGVVGVSDQAETEGTLVLNNSISVDSEGYSFGVVTRASGGSNVAETPETVVEYNEIDATADTYSGVGYGIESTDEAQVDADAQIVKDNTFGDVDAIQHKADSGTLDVTMNEWDDLENVSFKTDGFGSSVQNGGEIDYDPFLTSSPNASDFTRPGERTDFGHDLVVPADGEPHSVAFPAPVEGNVSEVFGEFDGTVYAYDGDEWESGEKIADEDVGALDAFVVTVDEDDADLRIDFEYAETDSPVPSMTTANLEAGWNFVGAPTGNADSEEAFAGSTAEVTTVIDVFAGQRTISTPYGLDAYSGVSNPGEVSPFKGYWVFVTDDGELGATVPVDPTQETEEGALTGN
ncbi:right-handed parallel beta-helix repeat-containing protein [Halorubrum sp. HHNYT27]|uniref:right-handed parallel beta-helix repeat-containing protein n=1 Tax=Halorubrum sp. HHNYT27 TaxID=3402275 RepID=UPI003EBCF0AE